MSGDGRGKRNVGQGDRGAGEGDMGKEGLGRWEHGEQGVTG